MANPIQSSAVQGDSDDIDNVCSTSDTNAPGDDKPEPPRQATPYKGMDVVLRRRSAFPASQDPTKACENLEKVSPKNPTSACAPAGSIFDAENHDLRPQNTVSRPQQGLLEPRSVLSGSGDEGMTSAPNNEAKNFIARGLDRLSMELQFVFSEFLSRQYAQIDDLMRSSLSEIQCQEKEQERLLNQMVSFLNAMKNAFAIFGGSE
ncbi:hypothetical protein KVV02_002353 [Mortierella alpina]|uniref:Uncharacterized protein n=1 Tax=Mortierella alpina TaxID=64518 RepID=A0A9P8A1A1_MORAP|nr:hypothetical protein KVV02_002353 [Mortierella alpina]